MTLRIRPAIRDDADGIARVFVESAEHHAGLDPERYFSPDFSSISERYRTGGQHPSELCDEAVTLVADVSGVIVGFVDVRLERPTDAMHRNTMCCHIAEIAVLAQRRRQGFGESLLRAAEEWGRQRGAEFASLEYNAANTGAADFYQTRMGYRVASITAIKRLAPAR